MVLPSIQASHTHPPLWTIYTCSRRARTNAVGPAASSAPANNIAQSGDACAARAGKKDEGDQKGAWRCRCAGARRKADARAGGGKRDAGYTNITDVQPAGQSPMAAAAMSPSS
jgi:hypothetical protein